MNVLEVAHLRKTFGDFVAVDDLSFEVAPGEVFGLIGPNGAGKTTTMNMITGLLRPDAGNIRLAGRLFDPRDRQLKLALGVVPQDLAIYPELTARDNLRFFGKMYGLTGTPLKDRVDQILERIGLTAHADQHSKTFSGGMKRRLNFGVALLHEPRLIILDEPTVGVDPQSRSHLLDNVQALARDGVGAIYATHYMEEVEAICHRVGIVDHGRLLALGTLDELLSRGRSCIRLKLRAVPPQLPELLSSLPHVDVATHPEPVLTITGTSAPHAPDSAAADAVAARTLRDVLSILDQARVEVLSIDTERYSLERLFLELTGRSLRD